MGILFPSAPTEGQVFNVSPGKSFVFLGSMWRKAPLTTALPKNYVVNPAMQISQQNGAAAVTANGAYPVDEWFILKGGGNYVSVQQLVETSPLLAPFVIGRTTTTGFPAPAGTDAIRHKIEGSRIADLRWGTAEAKQVVLRYSAWTSTPGLYAFSLGNGADDRSYVIPVNYTNTPQEFTFVIPGDTSGTWATDNTAGMILSVVANVSTGDQTATPLQWLATKKFGVAGMTSIAGDPNAGKWIAFGRVGLYADPYLTGVAPDFEIPDAQFEMRRCQRYWLRGYGLRGFTANTVLANRMALVLPTTMRITPAIAAVGSPRIYEGTATPVLGAPVGNYSNTFCVEADFTVTTVAAQRSALNYRQAETDYLAISARM